MDPLLPPMLARSVDRLPEAPAGGWLYEPKYDGYRAIGGRRENGLPWIVSRRGTQLTSVFPEIAAALEFYLRPASMVDGEIVRWSPEGRLDFDGVQYRYAHRNRAGELGQDMPCHLVAFDLLEDRGTDLTHRPLSFRRSALERRLGTVTNANLTIGLQTADPGRALEWYDALPAVGVEGIVAKPAQSRYIPGGRQWVKWKVHTTTEAIIGGYTGPPDRPVDLVLGRYASGTGRLYIAGRSSRIDDRLAAKLAPLLQPAGSGHPWPESLPPSWGARREPTPYTRVEPRLVVEIRADPATTGRRWRHRLRVVRLRDTDPNEIPRDLGIEG